MMNFKFLLNFKILTIIILGFAETSFAEELDFSKVGCLSCSHYQICYSKGSEIFVTGCEKGRKCSTVEVFRCWLKLKDHISTSVNECTRPGIFPNVKDGSKYYVCLTGSMGFEKHEFVCPKGFYFDESQLVCARDAFYDYYDTEPESMTEPPAASSTTTKIPTTPATTTTTTTTKPNTTSSTTTTTTTPKTTTTSSTTSTTTTTPKTTTTSSTTSTTTTTPKTTTTSSTTSTTTTPKTTTTSSTTTTTTTPKTTTSSTTSTTTTPKPTTTSSTTTTTTTTTRPPLPTPIPFICTAPGVFPNLYDCKTYYRCSPLLKPFHYTCPGTSYFNEEILKCSFIITPYCQDQISNNFTTVSPSSAAVDTSPPASTTTTTPVSSTKAVTVTTSGSSTSLKTTPVPFTCKGRGIYPDPSNCITYYRCTHTGKVYTYTCPKGTYFDEYWKQCTPTLPLRCKKEMEP